MNAAQREAITAGPGAVLVLAGPGSGKTRVLTHRIAYLIEERHVRPGRIMAVTFTNKAANEMRERVEKLIGEEDVKRLTIGTFHSICARILRREAEHIPYTPQFVIYDTQDQKSLVKDLLKKFNISQKQYPPGALLAAISAAKNEMQSEDEMRVSSHFDEIRMRVYRAYEATLRQNDAMDFDDLLLNMVRLFRSNPDVQAKYHRFYQWILVDEFQDTNMPQYELVKLLTGSYSNVFVVGDPDQSIYAFRGADYRNVRRFQRDYQPKVILLEENYRSHQYVLDAAMAVIRKNPDHIQRNLYSQRKTGPKIIITEAFDDREEVDFVVEKVQKMMNDGTELRDIAIMYRTNAQSRGLEEAFVKANIPHVLTGTTRFYGRREIRDVVAYLRVMLNPNDRVSMQRIINVPPRGIGAKTAAQFFTWAEAHPDGLWGALQALAKGEPTPLSGRSKSAMTAFAEIVEKINPMQYDSTPLEVVDAILESTGYMEYLAQDTSKQGQERLENVESFRDKAASDEDLMLEEFLENIALVADPDTLEDSKNAVSMLTLHAAKGLEFPVVFLVGLEEGTFPHWRSTDDIDQMAEERRLMYVGLTRAKEQIFMSYAFQRMRYGHTEPTEPSRFIFDIPGEITNQVTPAQRPYAAAETSWQNLTQMGESLFKTTAPLDKESRFKAGQRVHHKKYGDGTVVNSKVYGDIEEVEIDFNEHGIKRIDGSYLDTL
jgi:DNA helicase-2/ATP-dependent DNA helicase PcrA